MGLARRRSAFGGLPSMRLVRTILAAATAATLAAGSASAVTFDFTGGKLGANGTSASRNATVAGLGVAVTGGTYVFDTFLNAFDLSLSSQNVTKNNDGLGVDCKFDLLGACPNNINGPVDLLTLTFDKEVFFDHATFTEIDKNDDFDLFIDGKLVGSDINIAASNPYLFASGLRGFSVSFGADAASFFKLDGDNFRLGAISVTPVPLPAALPMLALALGAVGVAGRRRARAA
jgi:hypothetical protein